MSAFKEGRLACVLIECRKRMCRSDAVMRLAVGVTRGTKVLGLCLPLSTSVALHARATRALMLSWDLRCPNNNAEIVRIVLIVLLTRHGTVPSALGQAKPGTESKRTTVQQALGDRGCTGTRCARDFPAVGKQIYLPGGAPSDGLKHQQHPWDGRKMTYDDHCKRDVNPMDRKGPRMCSESPLQLLTEGM